jgi:hypothetical protein
MLFLLGPMQLHRQIDVPESQTAVLGAPFAPVGNRQGKQFLDHLMGRVHRVRK